MSKSSARRWWSLTRLEWGVLAAILLCLIVLLWPEAKWASSGEVVLPIRVVVFEAEHQTPIPDAIISIHHLAPSLPGQEIPLQVGQIAHDEARSFRTGADGMVLIDHKFRTGASHRSPTPRAHLRWEWVLVTAQGYGTVLIPVRHESQTVESVRQQSELLVPIGLMN